MCKRSASLADRPHLPARLVDRPALMEAIDDAVEQRVVVVSAGLGWGKTITLAAWAACRRVCWLGVSDSSVSLAGLSGDLLQALRRQVPRLPAELVMTTTHGTGDDAAALVTTICGLLKTYLAEPVTLVVDDAGLFRAGSDGAWLLEGLCQHRPEMLRLVLLTRKDLAFRPTSAGGSVHEIHSRQLAFTRQEIAAILGPGREALAETVWTRTAGWPAAVLLCRELLGDGCALPPGNDWGAAGQALVDLAARVLADEPEPVRSLLSTLALLDRASADLCVALGFADAHSRLPALARRGLLAVADSDQPLWMVPEPVSQLLTMDVDTAATNDLRCRAATRCERLGEHGEALRHLTAARNWAAVTQLLLRRDEEIVAAGQVEALVAAVERLPAAEFAYPGLYLVWGYGLQHRGDWVGALSCYQHAAGPGSVHARLAWRMGQLYDLTGRTAEAMELFGRVSFGETADLDEVRLLFLGVRWSRERGDRALAWELASRCARAAIQCGGHVARAWSNRAFGLLAAYRGDRLGSEMYYGQALAYAGRAGDVWLEVTMRTERAWFLAEEAAPGEALAEIGEVLRLGRQAGLTGHEPACLSFQARAKARLGRLAEALADATRAQSMCAGAGRDAVYALIVLGEVHRRRGEPGQAQAFLDEVLHLAADQYPHHPARVLAMATQARILAATDLDGATELVERAVALSTGLDLWRTATVLAHGWVALLSGDRQTAMADARTGRALTGQRRDHAGLAESLQLAALSTADPKAATALLTESVALCRSIGDPVGEVSATLARAQLAGHGAAGEQRTSLRRLGVCHDHRMADLLGAVAPRPARLSVHALGSFQVLRDGVPVPTAEWQSKKARDLLKILIARRGQPVPRCTLVDLLWPDDRSDRTGNRLSVLLSTLRTVLTAGGKAVHAEPIIADRNTVQLDLSVVDVDAERFCSVAAAALAARRQGDDAATARYLEADELYRGEFLAGDLYADWTVAAREEIREIHTTVLRALAQLVSDPDQRIGYLNRLLELDGYDEPAHRGLVDTLRAAGRHGEALRRYTVYLNRMEEIGVTPDLSTVPAERVPPPGLRVRFGSA